MKVDLRAEAEADAARIRAIRTKAPEDSAPLQSGAVALTVLRRPAPGGVIRSGAIFFIRTRVVDGSGRLVENLLIPVEVPRVTRATSRTRRDIGAQAREIFDAYQGAVRSVALVEVARRISALSTDHGLGLERARARESRLVEQAENRLHVPLQAGLFDGRGLQNRDRPVHFHATKASSSLLVAQPLEFVLLLVVTPGA